MNLEMWLLLHQTLHNLGRDIITLESIIKCNKINIDDGPQEEYSCSGTPVDLLNLHQINY